MQITVIVCSLIVLISGAHGWDNAEMEMYDLIEELGQNFYDFLGLPHVSLFFILLLDYFCHMSQIHL